MSSELNARGHIGRLQSQWDAVELDKDTRAFFNDYIDDCIDTIRRIGEEQDELTELIRRARQMMKNGEGEKDEA